jgi:hypothetical protein
MKTAFTKLRKKKILNFGNAGHHSIKKIKTAFMKLRTKKKDYTSRMLSTIKLTNQNFVYEIMKTGQILEMPATTKLTNQNCIHELTKSDDIKFWKYFPATQNRKFVSPSH